MEINPAGKLTPVTRNSVVTNSPHAGWEQTENYAGNGVSVQVNASRWGEVNAGKLYANVRLIPNSFSALLQDSALKLAVKQIVPSPSVSNGNNEAN